MILRTLATFMPSDRDFDDLGWETCDLEGTDWMLGPLKPQLVASGYVADMC